MAETLPYGTDLDNCFVTPSAGVGRVSLPTFLAGPTFAGSTASNLVTAAGTNQAGATPITGLVATVGTASAGQGIGLPAIAAGEMVYVYNLSGATIKIYPAVNASDTVNGFAASTGLSMLSPSWCMATASAAGAWQISGATDTKVVVNTSTITSSGTASVANVTGADAIVVLNMTGSLSAGATLTTPSAAAWIAGMHLPVAGKSFDLRVINSGTAAQSWTIAAGTSVSLVGTMTIAQNTWRGFAVTVANTGSITLTSIGTGTNS